ncbi:MAG: BTAD domain-containing putative transcriptional regulator [Thermoleophilia bacterium]
MSLTICLLGPPGIARDGTPVPPPRGGKAWGLLAHLLLSGRPVGRRELAALLFPEADDPLGALRWSLAELRRALGLPDALRGDPPVLELPPGTVVDALSPSPDDAGGDLLEGMSFDTSPGFDAWLSVERRRQASALEAVLHEAALAALAAGRTDEAVRLATRVVGLNPLEEGHHELLVRSLAMAGDRAGALAHADRCDEILVRELGVPPSPAVRRAAYAADPPPGPPPSGGRAAARGQLEAGEAAAAAGAVETAVDRLRRACSEAAASGDGELRAQALVALGTTLIHACRGRDEEGSAVLHQAIAVAERTGDRASGVAARRELGYVYVQAGVRERAERWLRAAEAMAEGDAELASVHAFQGMDLSDRADYGPALDRLQESVRLAEAAGNGRLAAWSGSLIGRLHMLRGDDAPAVAALGRTLDVVDSERWVAFRPWPETLLAELEMRAGDVDGAADRLEHAWSLACQVEDPCWEGFSARAIGLLEEGRGRATEARRWLAEAATRCTRVPDRYQWAHGYVLDARAALAVRNGDAEASATAHELLDLAARCGMRELVVRAQLHLAGLGVEGMHESAVLLARDIDNPVLEPLLATPV